MDVRNLLNLSIRGTIDSESEGLNMKRFFQYLLIAVVALFCLGFLAGVGGLIAVINPPEERVEKASILELELDGVIANNKEIKEFLEQLRKYRKDDRIKGVLVRISSPGGVVGPSQEIYQELKITREEFKKPVVAYCSSVAASGAFYAAMGADKYITEPGCLTGSIGVIMEFVNMEKLYEWAKVQRYSITTGKFKDAGAEYKPLSPEARMLFQDMLNDVLAQFKGAIVEGRKLKPDFVTAYADGRIFSGAQAVKLGFADKTGSWDDARKLLGEMTGLGKDAKVFKAKHRPSFMEFLSEASESRFLGRFAESLMRDELNAKPLFIMPGAIRF